MISIPPSGPWPACKQKIHFCLIKRIASLFLYAASSFVFILHIFKRGFKTGKPRVLILEPFGMGDVISLIPCLKLLAENHFEVFILAKKSWKEAIPSDLYSRWVDTCLPWSSYTDHEKYRSPFEVLRIARKIGKSIPDSSRPFCGIDPRGDARSCFFLRLLGCGRVLSLDYYLGSDLRVPPVFATPVQTSPEMPRWRMVVELLKPLGVNTQHCDRPRINSNRPKFELNRKQILALPIAPWPGKSWPKGHWFALEQILKKAGIHLVGCCGPGQAHDARTFLSENIPIREIHSIRQWIDLFASFHCIVTVDTGPMHLADACGLSVVALFGTSPLPLWAPSSPMSCVVHSQDSPDFTLSQQTEANAADGAMWMSRISPEEVFLAIDACLNKNLEGSNFGI
jgi:ADP-heptose:LPS heptosyltransferase